jgi:chromosomal replication initiator protein
VSNLTASQWQAVLAEIAREISPGSFQTWFRNIELGAPNVFMCTWIREQYMRAIVRAIKTVTGGEPEVIISISPRLYRSTHQEPEREVAGRVPPALTGARPSGAAEVSGAGGWGARLNRDLSLEALVVGDANRLAADAARAVVESPGSNYNPLFVYGAPGVGKTHLLQALCHQLRAARPAAAVLYLSCEEFTNAYIAAVQRADLQSFRSRCRGAECLVVDDIQFLAAKEHTQEEFFHTFDALLHAGRQVVLAASHHPREIHGLTEKLRTRFIGGLVAQMGAPDFETRLAIVRSKAARRRLEIGPEVMELVARRFEGSVRELEGAVAMLAAAARADGRAPDPARARTVLRQLAALSAGPPGIDDILKVVCRRYNVGTDEVRSPSRSRRVMVPRQLAMYLARRHTDLSLADVGREFSNRDHATVLYAERKAAEMIERDPQLNAAVEEMAAEIKGS